MRIKPIESSSSSSKDPNLCIKNCGFSGIATTMDMCSTCHEAKIFKEEWQQTKLAGGSTLSRSSNKNHDNDENRNNEVILTEAKPETEKKKDVVVTKVKVVERPRRCSTCRRRVGLTGFNCKCGHLFCSVHRYPDKHDCTYDYRTAAQDSIAKANPVVKAEKLHNKI